MASNTKPATRKPQPKEVSVNWSEGNFGLVTYVTRFGIEPLEGEKVFHFALLNRIGEQMSCFACIFDSEMLKQQKANWLAYLDKIGLPTQSPDITLRCPSSKLTGVPMVNAALWTRATEDNAEVRFYAFAVGDLYAARLPGPSAYKVTAQPLALLRCPIELQRQLLVSLYPPSL